MLSEFNQSVQTIDSPVIPVVHDLGGFGRFPVHSELLVTGASYAGGHRKGFAVELLAAPGVALHVNPRFKFLEHTVVLNSRDGAGAWQAEERHANPIDVGDNFQIRIRNCADHYEITVNNKHSWKFYHRISPSAVTAVRVEGDVRVDRLQVTTPSSNFSSPHNHPSPPPSAYGGDYGWQPPANPPYTPSSYHQPPSYYDGGYDTPGAPNISGPNLSQNPNPNVPQGPSPMYRAGDNFRPN